jgi:hypothetical protein
VIARPDYRDNDRRQWPSEVTMNASPSPSPSLPIPRRRWVLYAVFGVILPVVCVLADPAVFAGSGVDGRPMLRNFRVFGYVQIAVGVIAMAFFLWRQRPSAILSGILLECALFSLAIGAVLLFPSFLGLFVLIGILGFTPLLSAWVFVDAARRAIPSSDPAAGRTRSPRRARRPGDSSDPPGGAPDIHGPSGGPGDRRARLVG